MDTSATTKTTKKRPTSAKVSRQSSAPEEDASRRPLSARSESKKAGSKITPRASSKQEELKIAGQKVMTRKSKAGTPRDGNGSHGNGNHPCSNFKRVFELSSGHNDYLLEGKNVLGVKDGKITAIKEENLVMSDDVSELGKDHPSTRNKSQCVEEVAGPSGES